MAAKSAPSLTDLEKLVEERQAQVQALLEKRDELERTIEELDAELQHFMATGSLGRRTRKRPKNESSLRVVVMDILGKNKKGLSLKNLAEQVKATGYKSQSRNFTNVVYQCVYNTESIIHDEATGLYRLKK